MSRFAAANRHQVQSQKSENLFFSRELWVMKNLGLMAQFLNDLNEIYSRAANDKFILI